MTPKKIKAIRTELNLSQEGFAELLSVSKLTVTRWETGKNKPQRDRIDRMRALLTEMHRLEGHTGKPVGLVLGTKATPKPSWVAWPRVGTYGQHWDYLSFHVCPLCGVAVANPERHIAYHKQRNEEIPVLDPAVFWGNKKS